MKMKRDDLVSHLTFAQIHNIFIRLIEWLTYKMYVGCVFERAFIAWWMEKKRFSIFVGILVL